MQTSKDPIKALLSGAGMLLAILAAISLLDLPIFWEAYPDPRAKMREPVSRGQQPRVLVLGSSTAAFGIVPDLLAKELGMPPRKVVNAAFPGLGPEILIKGYRDFESELRSVELILFFTDDYFLHTRPAPPDLQLSYVESIQRRIRSQFSRIGAINKLGNARTNIYNAINPLDEHRYSFDGEGLLRYAPLERFDNMADPVQRGREITGLLASWWTDMLPDAREVDRLAEFGRAVRSKGARIVFIHMPVHPEYRQRMLAEHKADFEHYVRGMNEVARRAGSRFIFFDQPGLFGFEPLTYTFDAIHLGPAEARKFTRYIAAVLRDEGMVD